MSVNKFVNWPPSLSSDVTSCKLGYFKEYPKIKLITLHCVVLVPFCGDQIKLRDDDLHKFYLICLINTVAPLMCGYAFFGPDHWYLLLTLMMIVRIMARRVTRYER